MDNTNYHRKLTCDLALWVKLVSSLVGCSSSALPSLEVLFISSRLLRDRELSRIGCCRISDNNTINNTSYICIQNEIRGILARFSQIVGVHKYLVHGRFVWWLTVFERVALQPSLIEPNVPLSPRPPACARPRSSCHHPSALLIAFGFHLSTSNCFSVALRSEV